MKIISMDKFKADDTDRKLRAMFSDAPLADDGFSEKIMQRLRRDERRRQLLVTTAVVVGGLFATGPLLQLFQNLGPFIVRMDSSLTDAAAPLAAVQTGIALPLIGALLLGVLAAVRLLEE